MSKLSNMPQTKEAKEQYNHPIVDILLDRHTKQELQEILHCGERAARDVIAECSMHYPIISNSDSTSSGYRRARNIDELSGIELESEIQAVQRTLSEHSSRVKCLKKKMKPLIAWLKVAQKKRDKENKLNGK
jgi:hypothetical protein